ncbi:MAG: isocitrate/isopropylmalate family dehydrogenase [Candidatus Rokubacteria bacterium]|nr:isocitrate/isopropylmalate family dehydrogenase [Candidatus Rokubacteria bacterium]
MSATEMALAGPEVVVKASRRRFTMEDKREIVREADGRKTPGAVPREAAVAADAALSRERRRHRIGVIPGDGIGPEVVAEGLKVLRALAPRAGFAVELVDYPFGAEHWLRTGEVLSASALEEMRGLDAIYFGAAGDPRVPPGVLELGLIHGIVQELDLFVNVRPIRLYAERLCPVKGKGPADVDLVVIREATEDCFGAGRFIRKGAPDEVALGQMAFSRPGQARALRYAFELARRRGGKRRVSVVHQDNAIGAHDLIERVSVEVAREFPDVERDHMAPDAAAMWLIKNPEAFDVIFSTNLIGGILSDITAVLGGGLGLSGSARIHPGRTSLFEPTHGSAPKYAGQGVASPIGAIAALGLLLEEIGEAAAAGAIERAVGGLLASGTVRSVDARSGQRTAEVGDLVAGAVSRAALD